MKIYAIDAFLFDLPTGHRFPLGKYRLLRELVETRYVPPCEIAVPAAAVDDEILLAHTPEYLHKLVTGGLSEKEVRRLGLPWSPELVARARRSVGATIAAGRSALQEKAAASLSGGTHHACSDHGQGFCVFNDVAVALRVLKKNGLLERALVVDADVHQGNGTAEILSSEREFFTFSIHADNNYPFRKISGDMDVGLPDGTGDEVYLEVFEEGVRRALSLASPDLVMYLAGADPYEGDLLGRLSLTKDGLLRRDRLLFDLAGEEGLPVALVMSGGYGRDIRDTADIQSASVGVALDYYLRGKAASGGSS